MKTDPLPPPDPLDRLLPLRAVARLTGLNERTLRAWCARGRLPGAWQPGGHTGSWYVPARTLVARGLLADDADDAEPGANGAPLRGSKHDDEA